MFTIIGGDGKEYGPVSTDQVRAWISAGRANLETKARASGSDDWRRLADFPEFTPTAEPPAMTTTTPTFAPTPAPVDAPVGPPLELASRGSRLGAAIIDRIIALVAALPGILIMGPAFFELIAATSRGEQPNLDEIDAARFALGGFLATLGWLVQLGVQIWLLSTRGQSLGKLMLKIRIVIFRDNARPGFLHAWLLRNFVPAVISMVPYLGFLFVIVDVLFIFGEQRRCIHDHIAGTKVVKAEGTGRS